MSFLSDLVAAGDRIDAHRPWPRAEVPPEVWQAATRHLATGALTLFGLWAEPGMIHMALLEPSGAATPILPPSGSSATAPVLPPSGSGATASVLSPSGSGAAASVLSPSGSGAAAPVLPLSGSGAATPVLPPSGSGATMSVASDAVPVAVLSIACVDNRYPSVGAVHAPAIRLERAIRDLFGLEPEGLPDARPWLDHGRWDEEVQAPANAYAFLPAEGEALHQIPVGPVHAGIIEPGHFRFTCDGETVVRLEQRLGYVHKGVELLMSGASVTEGARLAGRMSGDSTVAYALAFSRAVETAAGITPPPRAVWLRAVMAELERVANHIGDFGAICNDAAFSMMLAHAAVLRERVLRAAAESFDHRLMMDRIVPGGIAADLPMGQVDQLRVLVEELRIVVPRLIKLYDTTPSLQDRTVGTGIVRPDLARRFAPGGFIGRASGRDFDVRRDLCYAPYDTLTFKVPLRTEGDVNARVWIRLLEIGESLSLLDQLLTSLPSGPVMTNVGRPTGEGVAVAESFRGDILVWLRVVDGSIDRCHLRDPSWFQWPLLEAAIEGNIVADFPLCNKSFNCSYSGHDL